MLIVVIIVMMVPMMMLLMLILIIVVLIHGTLHLLNPCGGSSHAHKVELARVENLIQIHVAVVALDDVGLRLERAHNLFDALELLRLYLCSLVQQYDIAELNLLNHQVLNVLIVDVGSQQVVARTEFVLHAQGVNHCHDTVEHRVAVLHVFLTQLRDGADGLGDRGRLADAARLNHDIVELLHLDDVAELLHQVHFQRAADAPVLKGHQTVVLATHDAAFLYQVGVYVHLADVVHDHGEFNSSTVRQDTVQQRRLSAAQISCQ